MTELLSNTLRDRRLQLAGSVLAVTALLSACGSSHNDAEHKVNSSTPSGTSPEFKHAAGQRHSKYHVIFDYLNHGSKVIDVYDSPTSKAVTGTFEDGQSAPAYCKEEGRPLQSKPGETPVRRSDEWIEVKTNATNNSTEYFASAVYIEQPDTVLAELPDC